MGFNRSVFRRYENGPKGLGDPDDTYLSKPEQEVMVMKVIRERTRIEKCPQEVAEFTACAKENRYFMVLNCRESSRKMKECLAHWYNNEDFIKYCTKLYLQDRSEYRRTGLTKQEREQQQKMLNAST